MCDRAINSPLCGGIGLPHPELEVVFRGGEALADAELEIALAVKGIRVLLAHSQLEVALAHLRVSALTASEDIALRGLYQHELAEKAREFWRRLALLAEAGLELGGVENLRFRGQGAALESADGRGVDGLKKETWQDKEKEDERGRGRGGGKEV